MPAASEVPNQYRLLGSLYVRTDRSLVLTTTMTQTFGRERVGSKSTMTTLVKVWTWCCGTARPSYKDRKLKTDVKLTLQKGDKSQRN